MDSVTEKLKCMEVDETIEITKKVEKIDIKKPVYKNAIRKDCYLYLFDFFSKKAALKHGDEFIFKDSNKTAKNIEKSINNKTIQNLKAINQQPSWQNPKFRKIYCTHFRRIVANITYTPNAKFVLTSMLIKREGFKPRELVYRSRRELAPELWVIRDKEIEKIGIKFKAATGPKEEDVKEGIFQCGKCKSKKTTYYEKQTRSADEPMTVFITCVKCDNRWKQ